MAADREIADVVILGAGVAGLAAGVHLHGAGRSLSILEARPRIGGRVHTLHPDAGLPVELGAEFLDAETFEMLPRSMTGALVLAEMSYQHRRDDDPERRPPMRAWDELSRAVRSRKLLEGPDLTFAEFLRRHFSDPYWSDITREALAYVQGFHAADAEKASAQAIFASEQVVDEEQFRVVQGLDALVDALTHDLRPALRLESVVTRIRWSRDGVMIEARSPTGAPLEPIEGRRALITLPVGVLQQPASEPGGVAFDPEPAGLRAAARAIAMGDAFKIVLEFDERFWEGANRPGAQESDDWSFLHEPGRAFPTWWNWRPLRAPMLTGWVGGPSASRLVGESPERLLEAALDSLSEVLGTGRGDLLAHLRGWFVHDWREDPLARGAYTYPAVGAEAAVQALSRDVEGTLWFAGEALARGGRHGTVHGAIASGLEVARRIESIA